MTATADRNTAAGAALANFDPPATAVEISLKNGATTSPSAAVNVVGDTVTIQGGGAFVLRGNLSAGRVLVDAGDDEQVWLILDGVDVTNPTGAAISVRSAGEVLMFLEAGTTNHLADGTAFTYDDPAEEEPNAALFSKADLTIGGDGSLAVDAAFNDGIASKDALTIVSGTYSIRAADDGIRGRDSVVIAGGAFTIDAGGDGIVSDNDEDPDRGYVTVESGTFDIDAAGDGIQAETRLHVVDGTFQIVTGGGHTATLAADDSAKGLKAAVEVAVDAGAFVIDAADDAVHSNGTITIDGGDFTVSTADDAVHADEGLTVQDGKLDILASFEGLEALVLTISGGEINIVSRDDGLNVAGGVDASGVQGERGAAQPPATNGGAPPAGGFGGAPGGGFARCADCRLTISGGVVVIDAAGDGLDANGSIVMTGGTVVVHGPTVRMNGAIDFDGTFDLSGGTVVAAGSAGMAQAPSKSSAQPSISARFGTAVAAGTVVEVRQMDGTLLLVFKTSKSVESLVFSSAALVKGDSYEIRTGGVAGGESQGGVYATATGGTRFTVVTAA